MILSRKKLK